MRRNFKQANRLPHMNIMKNRLFLSLLLGLGLFSACKKDDVQAPDQPTEPDQPATTASIKDSAVLYAKDIYLWYNQIPGTFNGANYGDPDQIMTALRQYSTEPGFSQPVDRWSFAESKDVWDGVSSGIAGDFGLDVFFRTEGDLRVKFVEKESPAGRVGVRRGWRITRINGNTNMTTGNADFIVGAVWNSNSSSFTFQKPDGSSVDMTFSAAQYREEPVYLDTVYTVNNTKVGYLVFNSFMGDTSRVYNDFARVFNRFAAANVTDVVVDLRYNGGGYVTVQEKLANYLAPSSANGGVMMKQEFNNKYPQFNSTTHFSKTGSLNPSRLFFIVSNSTASASELLINNLKPYMEVKLVGPGNTYGKPVGFFPIPVGDWYIFPVSFRTTNRDGQGNYYNGLPVNSLAADGLDKDWGDVNEASLSSVLTYISTGAFRTQPEGTQSTETTRYRSQTNAGNQVLDRSNFKGTVDPRRL
jgi:carboxyl-terminal processing protease